MVSFLSVLCNTYIWEVSFNEDWNSVFIIGLLNRTLWFMFQSNGKSYEVLHQTEWHPPSSLAQYHWLSVCETLTSERVMLVQDSLKLTQIKIKLIWRSVWTLSFDEDMWWRKESRNQLVLKNGTYICHIPVASASLVYWRIPTSATWQEGFMAKKNYLLCTMNKWQVLNY